MPRISANKAENHGLSFFDTLASYLHNNHIKCVENTLLIIYIEVVKEVIKKWLKDISG